MPPTTLLLVRHGETDWNRDRRVQGHTDVPLNATGVRQAHELAGRLAGYRLDAVYSSDLVRAIATAEAVAAPRGLEVVAVPGLRERSFGSWEGLTDVEARRRYPEQTQDPRGWGDGETQQELAARVVEALLRIGAAHAGGTMLAVSHGGPLRVALRYAGADGDGPLENCAVVSLEVEDGALRSVD
jgi:probable phosphoglycerate mutase